MNISIHNQDMRFIISLSVLLIVTLLIMPHLVDEQPPLIVEILLKPAEWINGFYSRFLPHTNIGTTEYPVYEGSPLDYYAGLAFDLLCILMYPFLTFLFLSLLSRILKRKEGYKDETA